MENKKRTLTPEQLEKMREGRKKAMDARRVAKEEEDKKATKAKKEAEKEAKRAEKRKKEEAKQRELQKELEALQQQKDRIEGMKKTYTNRNKFKAKMDEIKNPEPNIAMDVADMAEEFIDDIEHHEIIAQDFEEDASEDEQDIFMEKRDELLSDVKNPKTRELFSKITNRYDKSKDITQNLNTMVSNLKQFLIENTKEIKKTQKIIEKEEQQKPIIERDSEEVKEESRYRSQLSSLMRLR